MKKQDKKTYPVSGDLQDIMNKSYACSRMVRVAMAFPFGYNKGKKAAIEAERYRISFWTKVNDIYPELKRKKCTYCHEDCEIKLDE